MFLHIGGPSKLEFMIRELEARVPTLKSLYRQIVQYEIQDIAQELRQPILPAPPAAVDSERSMADLKTVGKRFDKLIQAMHNLAAGLRNQKKFIEPSWHHGCMSMIRFNGYTMGYFIGHGRNGG